MQDKCKHIRMDATFQIKSHQSEEPLGIDDFYILGECGMATQDYGLAAQWFDLAVTRGMQQQEQHGQQRFSFSLSDASHQLAQAQRNVR